MLIKKGKENFEFEKKKYFQPGGESELKGINQIKMWGSPSIKDRVKESSKLKISGYLRIKHLLMTFTYDDDKGFTSFV